MQIDTTSIYEIGGKDNKIVFTYKTKKDADNAHMKMHKESAKEYNKYFPDGVF